MTVLPPGQHAARADETIAVIGGGMAGALVALEAADRGASVVLFEADSHVLRHASRVNEGKIHLGYVYAADSTGQTARRMIEGALAFRPIIERWVGARAFDAALTDPFDYLVPHDSQLSPEQLEAHLSAVDRLIAEASDGSRRYLGEDRLEPWQRLDPSPYRMGPRDVVAAYTTPERAVDTFALADAIAAAIHRHPRICIRLKSRVRRCSPRKGGWSIQCDGSAATDHGPFRQVVNAAWAGRRQIDRDSGFDDGADWFTRFKFSVNIETGPGGKDLRNMTAFLGTYGDVVAYPGGRVYLSWYPAGMVSATTGPEMRPPQPSAAQTRRLHRQTVANLSRLYPALSDLPVPDFDRPHTVSGGFIVARGTSDIDDTKSQLHERHAIGLHRLAPGYFTLDTGKYTTAPALALATADALLPRKVIHAAI
ncbi:MAG: FAD-dependent oxidoreductase [Alterinioella nitratireducens]|uniref:FAD-dependent oxidoreductase n=2 Tax=Alterinioella nitratireducens TaxID=2735915 RepID=UPI0040597BAB